jgi:hypothetical protein
VGGSCSVLLGPVDLLVREPAPRFWTSARSCRQIFFMKVQVTSSGIAEGAVTSARFYLETIELSQLRRQRRSSSPGGREGVAARCVDES